MDRGSLELLLGQGLSVENIAKRFGKHPSTVSYWMAKHGLTAVNRDKHSARGGIERERLEPLVEAGMTIAQIALELGRSKGTVRHWLRRHGLRTNNTRGPRHPADTRQAKEAGLAMATLRCLHHGETEFVLEGRGYYRCRLCRSAGIVNHRRKLKEVLVAEAGGRCVICGYDRCVSVLEFHHLDPKDKRLGISAGGLTLSIESLRAEVAKCALLCSNCHGEVERGVTALPVQSAKEHQAHTGR
jgi:transposase